MAVFADIKKTLGNFQLDVQFEAGNEILALLGASGCGKSMTLKCIAGVETPDEGRIVLDGRVLFDSKEKINLPPQKRGTGYLFQHYALFPNMTVEENIAAGIQLPRREKSRIVQDKIKAFYLDGLEIRYPSQISGGQQQRVALARILASQPKILMLDEPFSALDSYLRWQMEQEISSVLEKFEGTTLFVSHNRDEVYRICNKIAVISDGHLETVSEKWALFNNPQSLAAALLTGCKNISAAKKLSDYSLEATDWNVVLNTEQKVPDSLRYIGVRAHYFIPSVAEDQYNTVTGTVSHMIEDTFSMIFMVQCGSGKNGQIRWERNKNSTHGIIEPGQRTHLQILPKDILMMTK
nr:ATP-binding cassette domain-containing protein [uncultured Caproiciproducens sp.]